MHAKQGILHQRHTPQGDFTILPTEAANLPTETGLGGYRTPTPPPLSAEPESDVDREVREYCNCRETLI